MAQASFPQGIKTWEDKIDLIDDYMAKDVNEAYAEIIAIESFLLSSMPQIMINHKTGKTYRYSRQVSADGIPQIISEEVIE